MVGWGGEINILPLRVPILLPACLRKNISETTLRVGGLGLKEEKSINITRPACTPTARETATRVSLEEKPRYQITTAASASQPEKHLKQPADSVIYKSSAMQAKDLTIYLFTLFLIAMCIYLLARKHG